MKHIRKIVSQFFGFDRRERRGTFILAVMMMVLLIARMLAFRPGNKDRSSIEASLELAGIDGETSKREEIALFTFDPNTASLDELLKLGLTEKQAGTLISYRNAGAQFRKAQDINRVYGIDSSTAEKLVPWIRINTVGLPEKAAGKRIADNEHNEKHATDTIPGFTDLNTCSADDLMQFRGIGPVLSERIIRYRRLLGGFVDTRQLTEVYGLDSSVAVQVSRRLTLTYDSVALLSLDTMPYRVLARHPYIGPETARLIIKHRELMGVPVRLADLVRDRVMSHEQALRLAPYIRPAPGVTGDDYEFISLKVLK